ncbi:sn-glycerol-3-phosphate ABC transporter ATP-binding protein UgpC [Roseibium porphyridii]|uniref:Sn-glycerol-3-phosphate ABC transporter ATP-binding protein UgpC n=1 Tax=Roseibium porphyridii TaxID=2866279 RepID=A0ABY8F284_9HYPH|nr:MULTISPECIES: sn-glycerol-3-phosphate ABC transporter ATP-binding protein UgpC [Stappiaceae]QFT34519.1 sn-glycerol-3-phosphate import ATP-binding protein UgpC [Labrenzia sp. THAF82]WFE89491.1 sn-glycerol-3-phosphate ABC transporter ATP-binding protein UgpC [Roseibium sp. KMA01]
MPRIHLENLVKRYGDFEVLHGINLEMHENEFTVLVGPSGCGKSTTLRMIAGLETVSSGEIYINEKPVSHLEPKARDLAMVFQDYALYPHMNVAKNMSFALRLQRRPKAEIDQKVGAVADMLGLTKFLHRKPGELSGGQRQRVAMGRALTRDAGTFLFDEPLSNLDAKLRGQMRAELALMRQKVRKNMIYVTHDQIEAMTLADRIVVMHGGYIQQQGTPEELFKRPVNKFVAGFLGSPPMNFLDANLEERDGQLFVQGAGFDIALPEDKIAAAKAHSDATLTLGIRPSDLHFNPDAPDESSIDLKVIVSEYIGAQSVLLCACGDQNVEVELKSETPIDLGETLRFAVNTEGIHMFDRETEVAIR